MSDPLLPQDDGNTPLDDEEREGLKLSYVTTRGDLNAAEQQNILKAQKWALSRKHEVPSRDYLNALHKRMLGKLGNWDRSITGGNWDYWGKLETGTDLFGETVGKLGQIYLGGNWGNWDRSI